jgi:hypothetical protein
MSYDIRAVVARKNGLSGCTIKKHLVALEQNFILLPMTADLYDEVNRFEETSTPAGFVFLSDRVRDWLVRHSSEGPIAYIEAEIFGGFGSQGACVYEQGKCVIAPSVTSFSVEAYRSPSGLPLENYAINTALRRLGVVKSPGQIDEFASLGLDRCRQTDDWLESA